jgi:prolyl oligopeptidase
VTAYPPARRDEIVDDYHGTRVGDPYRWLEDPDSPDTIAWVDAQNALTRAHVETVARNALLERLSALYDYPRTAAPVERGGRYFFTMNDGLQNQPVLYVQEAADDPASRRVLLDPNVLSPDGTVALTAFEPNPQATLLAYALSRGGSDRQDLFVRDVVSGQDLDDRVGWAKFTKIAWAPTGAGFYYTRFPEPGTVSAGDENYFATVCFHRLGDAQEHDKVVFSRPDDREVVASAEVSTDGRWLVVTAFKGSSEDSEVFAGAVDGAGSHRGLVPVFQGFDAAYAFADSIGDRLYFRTTKGAPRGRVIAVECGARAVGDGSPPPIVEIIPEQADTLSTVALIGGRLVTVALQDASDVVRIHAADGARLGDIPLPALGSISGLTGDNDAPEFFIRFSSFTFPPAVFRSSVDGAPLQPFGPAGIRSVNPSAYEVSQVWYPSRDGTNISMFLVQRRGLLRDADRPVFLTGYGGFNINLTPQFDPAHFAWLEHDGVVAVPNLRGGGEYGEAWHRAGMFERKQNVFDDFIAAAEWLIANGYTRPSRIAIEGGSNGGLLVGAAMIQRPDLFGAVVCRVPVADMLRYHRFTVGRFWVSEYGCADDPQQFPYLYAYSPLHNVRDGVRYPPTLVMTADTDDRVAPGMAKKFAARLQAATAPDGGPILIRVETKAGHGAGKPIAKIIEEDADIFAFLFRYLQMDGATASGGQRPATGESS